MNDAITTTKAAVAATTTTTTVVAANRNIDPEVFVSSFEDK